MGGAGDGLQQGDQDLVGRVPGWGGGVGPDHVEPDLVVVEVVPVQVVGR